MGESRLPGTTTAADGLYQVAGGVWPHGHSQGPAGHEAQLHPRLVASHVVGGH